MAARAGCRSRRAPAVSVCLLYAALVVGCTSAVSGTPAAATPALGSPAPTDGNTRVPPAPTVSAYPTTTPVQAPAPTSLKPASTSAVPSPIRATQVPLFLVVTSPGDETEATDELCVVRGRTAPGAVVSINGDVAAVDVRGEFSHTVVLDDGANVIEIVASDVEGTLIRHTLLVNYLP